MVNKRPETLLPSVSEGWAAPSWEELLRQELLNTNNSPQTAEVQQATSGKHAQPAFPVAAISHDTDL